MLRGSPLDRINHQSITENIEQEKRKDIGMLQELAKPKGKEELLKQVEKARQRRTNLGAFPKMTEVVNGQYRIKNEPPLIVHVEELGEVKQAGENVANLQELATEQVKLAFDAYLKTLSDDRIQAVIDV